MAKLDQKQLLETLSDIARCGSHRDYDALIGAVNALWSWGVISTKLYERVHSLDLLLYEKREFNWMTEQDCSWLVKLFPSDEELDHMYDEYLEDKEYAENHVL